MSFLPVIRAATLIPILLKMGFRIIRQKGSHVSLQHMLDKTKKVTVPIHNKDLAKKTLSSVLKQAGISIQEFLRLLGK